MRLLLPLLLLASVIAEEAPRQLDPSKPADALVIVAQISAQVPLKLADSQALMAALQTLARVQLAIADVRQDADGNYTITFTDDYARRDRAAKSLPAKPEGTKP